MTPHPGTIITSLAPIRICDNGGWTDTWFAGHGEVFNIGVSPYVEVQIVVKEAAHENKRIVIHAENYNDHYGFNPASHSSELGWKRHPLIEASIKFMSIPDFMALEISIFSLAPAGASTGTSAAVVIALIGALDYVTPGRMAKQEIALAAQKVETDLLNQQCGIQDQICSTYGGINYIKMDNYPHARVFPIHLQEQTLWELEQRLALIYLGKSHSSSEIHNLVIKRLESSGRDNVQLESLRKTASRSKDALYACDFSEFGKMMIENNEAQRDLHPALISDDAQRIIEIAKEFNASGWKVNGAGGEGGSLTLLCSGKLSEKQAMIKAVEQENPNFKNIPIQISSSGLRVWSILPKSNNAPG